MPATVNAPEEPGSTQRSFESTLERLNQFFTTRRLFWITFVFAALVFCQLQFWKYPSIRDRANWDYFAQVISRGGVPYRDVVNIKTPLSAYLGAAAIIATRPFGVAPVIATRVTNVSMAALTVAFTFLVGALYFENRLTGLLAALSLCGISSFPKLNIDGIQPKTPMILFGLVSLWAVIRDRPFTAGLFGMLSALSWQPGLLFVGTGALACTRYFTSWRDGKLVRLIAGAAIPLMLLLGYLWLSGGLREFYHWCFAFNLQVYGPREFADGGGFFRRITQLIEEYFYSDRQFFLRAAAGILLAIALEIYFVIKRGVREMLNRAAHHQVIVATLVYLAFCRINIQGEQDLIPILPFVGIFSGFVLVAIWDRAVVNGSLFTRIRRPALEAAGCALLLLLVFYTGASWIFSVEADRNHLAEQQAAAAELAAKLQPGDQLWVHGESQLLVLLERTNDHKYTNLDHGKDNYLDVVEPGGFQSWFQRLREDRPRIVIFERTTVVDRRKEFLEWLEREYELHREIAFFTHYVRKDQPVSGGSQ